MDQVTAYPDSASSSPRSRSDSFDDPLYPSSQSSKLRLMCSYGGRIVPRPTDKSLCYLGGDTRILLLDRNSSLHDLLSKLVSLLNLTNFTLKYQLPNEDLDSLISLSSDEDLENMVDEYDRIANSGKSSSSRIRLFVFSGNMESSANSRGSIGSLLDDSKSETWFVDALNGTGIGVDGSSNLIGFDDGKVLDRDSSFGSTNSGLNLPPIRVRVSEDHRLSERNNLEEQFKKMIVYGSDDGRSDMRKQQTQQTVAQQGINQQQQKFPPVDAPISDPRLVYYEERTPQPSIPVNLEPNREIPVNDPPIPYRNQHIPIPVPATIPGSGYTLPTIPVQQQPQPPPPPQPQAQTQQQFVPINPQTFTTTPQHSQPQSQPQFIPTNPQAQNQQQQFIPTNSQTVPSQQHAQPQTQQQFVPVNPQTFSAPQQTQPQPQQQQQQFIPTNPQAIPAQPPQPQNQQQFIPPQQQPNPQTQDGQFIAGNPQSQSQQFEPANPQTIPVNPQAQPQQQQFIPTNPQTQQQQHQFIPANSQMIPPTQQSHPQQQQQQQQQHFIPTNPQTISQPQNQQQQFMPTNPQTQQSQPQNQQQQFIPANSQYVPVQSYYQVPMQQSHQSHYVPQSQPFDPSMPMYYVPVRQNQQPVSTVQVPKGGAPKSELQQPNMYRTVAPPSQMVHGGAPGGGEQGQGQYAGMRYHVLHHPGQVQGNNASAVYYTQAQTMPTQYQAVMSDAGQQGQQTMELKQNRGN